MIDHRVAIVGAGLAGLTAATTLVAEHGMDPAGIIVLESAPGVGGRLATETVDGARFDHGAQFFTVRTERFARQVDNWRSAGAVAEWCRGFAEADGYPRYRGTEGMQSVARHLAAGLDDAGVAVMTSAPVAFTAAATTAEGDGGLLVTWPSGSTTAASVILTPPTPASAVLLQASGLAIDEGADGSIGAVAYHRVLAILAVLERDPGFDDPGAYQQPDDPIFSFVADNRAKGISNAHGVTFHTAHGRSAELWDLDDGAVLTELRPEIDRYCGDAGVRSLHVRRWRYAGPIQALAEPCLMVTDRPGPVVLAGDGFSGSKVEGAFSSGAAAADLVAGLRP